VRAAFVRTLVELGEQDPRILLLTGDLGFMALEPFAERFPDRFFNVGVAEQNMVGLATGLAESGFIPFVYSIVTFASLRPYEFIRNGPVHQQFPVRIVGMGGGLEYGPNGCSHFGLEDVGIMRVQPGLAVMAPADHRQTASILRSTWDYPGPVYYRLGKDDRTEVPGLDGAFTAGQLQTVAEGSDVLILAMGAIASEAAAATNLLAEQGVSAHLGVVASMSPAPTDDLVRLLSRFAVVATIEAHYVNGGLGSLVAEVIAEHGTANRLVRCGIRTVPNTVVGSQQFLQKMYGLSADEIAATVLGAVRQGSRPTGNDR
jgi:transketolase